MARSIAIAELWAPSSAQVYQMQNPGATQAPKPQQLSATVVEIKERADGHNVITAVRRRGLDRERLRRAPRRATGDAVTIKPGLLGSFFMYSPSGAAMRVKRAK